MPFSPKNVHTFFVCFSFFPFKKTKKYIYRGWKQGLYIYFFVFLHGKKEKQTKKVCTFFGEKGIIIIVPFFLELYFFSGIIIFFRGYIFLVPGFVFFSFLALNPFEPIIFQYTNFFRGTDFPTWKIQS